MTDESVIPDLDVFNLPVFSVANLFPMIAQDELAELADDIRENGLQESIVIAQVSGEWMLIDGRNRLAACRLAGVEPTARILTTDPTAYVLSANVHRRHLTKGQQAMAVALAYPEASKLKRAGSSSFLKKDQDAPSEGHISKARFVLRHCRDKAEEVLRNAKYPLTVAYEEAQAIVEKQRLAEEERQRQLAALAILREEYSDLAALVDDQRLGLPEAIAAGEQRRETARLKAEQDARELAERERRAREAEEARLADEVRAMREAERAAREDYELRRIGFFEQLHNLICGISIIGNHAQVAQLDVYVANHEWERFSQKYHQKKNETLRTLQVAIQHLPILIEKLEKM
jgi:hypothetical protein